MPPAPPALNEKWTLSALLDWASGYLAKHQFEKARLEAELLIAHAFHLTRIGVYTQFDRPLDSDELAHFKSLLMRRLKHEPLAYIIGKKEFYALDFAVSPACLIPRPETELIVDQALDFCNKNQDSTLRVLELGCGSGCIGITIAKLCPRVQVTAIDISKEALAMAQQNAAYHGVLAKFEWINKDFCALSEEYFKQHFNLIVANLPYVSTRDYEACSEDIKLYEPHLALLSEQDGLSHNLKALQRLPHWLDMQGLALLEHGHGQHQALANEARRLNIKSQLLFDLAGLERVIVLQRTFNFLEA